MRRQAACIRARTPEKFFSAACRSVHLRGGFPIECGENVSGNGLEIGQSGVHSNQISQAGVEVSRWAVEN
jgi:hypothetical protein